MSLELPDLLCDLCLLPIRDELDRYREWWDHEQGKQLFAHEEPTCDERQADES